MTREDPFATINNLTKGMPPRGQVLLHLQQQQHLPPTARAAAGAPRVSHLAVRAAAPMPRAVPIGQLMCVTVQVTAGVH
eukprot:353797-Chlamydomonas_euryale.AAC.1